MLKYTITNQLRLLGFGPHACQCFFLINQSGSITVSQIARQLKILPNAVYRLTRQLSQANLITALSTYPVSFQSNPSAINNLIDLKVSQLLKLKTTQISKPSANIQTKVDILTGRDNLMRQYLIMAPIAKKTIDIISIGEPVPDEIKIVNVAAISRGVKIRFIVHQSNSQNQGLLHSWLRMGLEVRYFPQQGYHLVVFDCKQSILAVSNPANPEERSSIVINSPNLSLALKHYFDNIWRQAQSI